MKELSNKQSCPRNGRRSSLGSTQNEERVLSLVWPQFCFFYYRDGDTQLSRILGVIERFCCCFTVLKFLTQNKHVVISHTSFSLDSVFFSSGIEIESFVCNSNLTSWSGTVQFLPWRTASESFHYLS